MSLQKSNMWIVTSSFCFSRLRDKKIINPAITSDDEQISVTAPAAQINLSASHNDEMFI